MEEPNGLLPVGLPGTCNPIREVRCIKEESMSSGTKKSRLSDSLCTWKLVLLLAVLVFFASCVTGAQYAPTKESKEDYTINYTEEAQQ